MRVERLVEGRDDDAEPTDAEHGTYPVARDLLGEVVHARPLEWRQRRSDTSRQFTIDESITMWSRSPAVTQIFVEPPRTFVDTAPSVRYVG